VPTPSLSRSLPPQSSLDCLSLNWHPRPQSLRVRNVRRTPAEYLSASSLSPRLRAGGGRRLFGTQVWNCRPVLAIYIGRAHRSENRHRLRAVLRPKNVGCVRMRVGLYYEKEKSPAVCHQIESIYSDVCGILLSESTYHDKVPTVVCQRLRSCITSFFKHELNQLFRIRC